MRVNRSNRLRRALPLLAATALAIACSSDSVTGPTTRANPALILRFDSLMHTSTGQGPFIYSAIVEMLAEGAPVSTGTITVNGTTMHVNIMAQLNVGILNSAPFDSEYTVAAWKGNGADTAIVFFQSNGSVQSFTKLGATSSNDAGTGTVVLGQLGAACTTFTAPGDVDVPTPLTCQGQSSAASFSIVVGGGQGTQLDLPNQPLAGIRLETAAPPPPC